LPVGGNSFQVKAAALKHHASWTLAFAMLTACKGNTPAKATATPSASSSSTKATSTATAMATAAASATATATAANPTAYKGLKEGHTIGGYLVIGRTWHVSFFLAPDSDRRERPRQAVFCDRLLITHSPFRFLPRGTVGHRRSRRSRALRGHHDCFSASRSGPKGVIGPGARELGLSGAHRSQKQRSRANRRRGYLRAEAIPTLTVSSNGSSRK
jgi:hypothetical protein